MIDIFNVIQATTKYEDSTIDYCNQIIKCHDISKFEVDWLKYLHIFYIDKFNPIDINELIYLNINSTTNLSDNFNQLNIKFNILNCLNVSYNQTNNYNNYTLYKLQDIYISYLIQNNRLTDHLFNSIISINLEFKSKHIQLLNIFKDYIIDLQLSYDNYEQRTKNINVFIDIYIEWITNYLIKQYHNSKLGLDEIFEKLTSINKINESFINFKYCSNFTINVITNLIVLLEPYLDNILLNSLPIDNYIITIYNSVNYTESNKKYEDIILNFTEKWIVKNNHSNLTNAELIENLLKILPIIDYNKSENITKLYSSIFLNKYDLFVDIIKGLKYPITHISYSNTTSLISLISLYNDKEILWNEYFKSLYYRIINTINISDHNDILIALTYEYLLFEKLIDKNGSKYADITKLYLDDIHNSIQIRKNIQSCKFNFVDDKNIPQIIDKFDISLVDYTIINKKIYDKLNTKYNQLIDDKIYPSEIKQYLAVGQTYFSKLYETYNIEFYTEKSIINITVNNMNIICNIIQYTLISLIAKNNFNIKDLIMHVVIQNSNKNDNSLYLQSYIENLLFNNIIKLDNNILILSINEDLKTYDISTFEPYLINTEIISNLETETATDKLTIEYLRNLILVRMFKHNSTCIFKLDNIIEFVRNFIVKTNLNKNLLNIFLINREELIRCLSFIEKRDIIEQIKPNEYIYVV